MTLCVSNKLNLHFLLIRGKFGGFFLGGGGVSFVEKPGRTEREKYCDETEDGNNKLIRM